MRSTKLCFKHTGSRLPDVFFEVEVDDDRMIAVVRAKPFDSVMFAKLVTDVLPADLGVTAFDDDNVPGFGRGRAPFQLELEFDGLRFEAVVTKLLAALGQGVTVGLRPLKPG